MEELQDVRTPLEDWPGDSTELNSSPLQQSQSPKKRRPRKKNPSQVTHGLENSDSPPSDFEPKKQPHKELITQYAQLYMMLGSLIYPFDQFVGQLVISEAEKRATELVLMARHNKSFLAFLKRAVKQSDYISFVIGHGSMAYIIMAHYDLVPTGPFSLNGNNRQQQEATLSDGVI